MRLAGSDCVCYVCWLSNDKQIQIWRQVFTIFYLSYSYLHLLIIVIQCHIYSCFCRGFVLPQFNIYSESRIIWLKCSIFVAYTYYFELFSMKYFICLYNIRTVNQLRIIWPTSMGYNSLCIKCKLVTKFTIHYYANNV